MFLVASAVLRPINKAYVPEIDYVACSSFPMESHTWSEAMRFESAYELPQYYQPQMISYPV